MDNKRLITILPFCGAFLLSIPGRAAEFNAVQADKSTLAFTFKQMNVGMEGLFRQFSAQLAFDPDRIADAKVSLDVNLASIDTGSSDGDGEVASTQWFNTKAYPVARFSSNNIKPLGVNRYEVAGQLSIKGHTQAVTTPLTVVIQGKQAMFDGALMLKRADFSIGEGAWADFGLIANEVRVSFHILATARM